MFSTDSSNLNRFEPDSNFYTKVYDDGVQMVEISRYFCGVSLDLMAALITSKYGSFTSFRVVLCHTFF